MVKDFYLKELKEIFENIKEEINYKIIEHFKNEELKEELEEKLKKTNNKNNIKI